MPGTIFIAAALIDDGAGRVFLVRKRGTTAFMQPGGKIDPGETAYEALVRELAEELSFEPAEGEALFLGTFYAKAANEPGELLDASLFHLRTARAFETAAELEEGIWVSLADAQNLQLAPLTREYVLPLAHSLCG